MAASMAGLNPAIRGGHDEVGSGYRSMRRVER